MHLLASVVRIVDGERQGEHHCRHVQARIVVPGGVDVHAEVYRLPGKGGGGSAIGWGAGSGVAQALLACTPLPGPHPEGQLSVTLPLKFAGEVGQLGRTRRLG